MMLRISRETRPPLNGHFRSRAILGERLPAISRDGSFVDVAPILAVTVGTPSVAGPRPARFVEQIDVGVGSSCNGFTPPWTASGEALPHAHHQGGDGIFSQSKYIRDADGFQNNGVCLVDELFRIDWQGISARLRKRHEQGNTDTVAAKQSPTAGRSSHRIAMQIGPFNMPTVTFRETVVAPQPVVTVKACNLAAHQFSQQVRCQDDGELYRYQCVPAQLQRTCQLPEGPHKQNSRCQGLLIARTWSAWPMTLGMPQCSQFLFISNLRRIRRLITFRLLGRPKCVVS